MKAQPSEEEARYTQDDRDLEEKYRSLFEQSRDAIYITTRDGRFLDANQSALDLLGYKKEDMLRAHAYQVYAYATDRTRFQQEVESKGSVADFEVKLRRRDGTIIDCLMTSTVRRARDGAILGYQGIIHDITARKRMADRLRESEEKLRVMFESIQEGVVVFGLDGRVNEVNNAAVRLFGFDSKENALGNPAGIMLSPRERGKATRISRLVLENGQTRSGEFSCRRRGVEFDAELSIALLRAKDGNPTGFVVVARDITERKRLAANMQYYISEITRAQEEERRRIARELHDDMVQELVALAMEIEGMAKEKAAVPAETRQQLGMLWQKTQELVKSIRRFSSELRPDIIDRLGLMPALEFLLEELNRERKVKGWLQVQGTQRRLSPEAELVLFRIAQEGLRNIRKHSQASEVTVRVEFFPDRVKMTVADNGRGFQCPEVLGDLASAGKLGLLGMQERARLLGGSFAVHSAPGSGTRLYVDVAV